MWKKYKEQKRRNEILKNMNGVQLLLRKMFKKKGKKWYYSSLSIQPDCHVKKYKNWKRRNKILRNLNEGSTIIKKNVKQ